MSMMKAMSLRNGELAIRDLPRPEPGPGQLLVKVLACAICASDHHYMDHQEVAQADRSGMRVAAADRDVVMGHEFCGEVVEYGPDTRREWAIGSRVTATPALFVGNTLRIIGMAPDAPGGFGEYLLVSEGFTRPMPVDVPAEQLALIDAMAVGWYYSRVGGGDPQAVPLVVGLGAIGLSVVVALKQRGVPKVVAADFSESRRVLARALGADVVIDPAQEPSFQGWRHAAWGTADDIQDRIRLAGMPKCVVYECVGVEGVLGDIIEECPLGTRILTAGGSGKDTISAATAHLKGINIQFGGGPDPSDWFEMSDLVATKQVSTETLVGEVVGFGGLIDAFARARASSAPPRIVFRPDV